MGLNVTLDLSDSLISLPVVVTSALLTRSKIAVSALVHLLSFVLLLVGALRWVENILSVHRGTGRNTESVVLLLSLLWPVIAALVAFAEGLSHG